jgi:hypothetical protein
MLTLYENRRMALVLQILKDANFFTSLFNRIGNPLKNEAGYKSAAKASPLVSEHQAIYNSLTSKTQKAIYRVLTTHTDNPKIEEARLSFYQSLQSIAGKKPDTKDLAGQIRIIEHYMHVTAENHEKNSEFITSPVIRSQYFNHSGNIARMSEKLVWEYSELENKLRAAHKLVNPSYKTKKWDSPEQYFEGFIHS